MMRVLIVDDEPAARERLTVLMGQLSGVEVVGAATDGASALTAIVDLKPDLVLLDIQMPGLNGLTVAARLPAEQRPEVIFVTAFEIYAADAFEVDAVDYLLKPVRFDRLRQAIERAVRRRELGARPQAPSPDLRAIWVQNRVGAVRVPLSDIEWIEAAKDYVLLHTATRSHIHRSTMNALERKLNPAELTRVHRSAFVRPARVAEVKRLGKGLISLVLQDGVNVAVGPSYVNTVTERLALHRG